MPVALVFGSIDVALAALADVLGLHPRQAVVAGAERWIEALVYAGARPEVRDTRAVMQQQDDGDRAERVARGLDGDGVRVAERVAGTPRCGCMTAKMYQSAKADDDAPHHPDVQVELEHRVHAADVALEREAARRRRMSPKPRAIIAYTNSMTGAVGVWLRNSRMASSAMSDERDEREPRHAPALRARRA